MEIDYIKIIVPFSSNWSCMKFSLDLCKGHVHHTNVAFELKMLNDSPILNMLHEHETFVLWSTEYTTDHGEIRIITLYSMYLITCKTRQNNWSLPLVIAGVQLLVLLFSPSISVQHWKVKKEVRLTYLDMQWGVQASAMVGRTQWECETLCLDAAVCLLGTFPNNIILLLVAVGAGNLEVFLLFNLWIWGTVAENIDSF